VNAGLPPVRYELIPGDAIIPTADKHVNFVPKFGESFCVLYLTGFSSVTCRLNRPLLRIICYL
jgi:hypothetical protein